MPLIENSIFCIRLGMLFDMVVATTIRLGVRVVKRVNWDSCRRLSLVNMLLRTSIGLLVFMLCSILQLVRCNVSVSDYDLLREVQLCVGSLPRPILILLWRGLIMAIVWVNLLVCIRRSVLCRVILNRLWAAVGLSCDGVHARIMLPCMVVMSVQVRVMGLSTWARMLMCLVTTLVLNLIRCLL